MAYTYSSYLFKGEDVARRAIKNTWEGRGGAYRVLDQPVNRAKVRLCFLGEEKIEEIALPLIMFFYANFRQKKKPELSKNKKFKS